MANLNIQDLELNINNGQETYYVLRGVTFTVPPGAKLGLVGESGCGKSMTATSIMRLLPKNAIIDKGQIMLDQIDLIKLSEKEMRQIRGKRITLIFQDAASALNPLCSAVQHVADVYARHNSVSKKKSLPRAYELLAKTGIPKHLANNYPHELSGGMCQRVMIAMALACSPEILIADEPTTGLDVTIQIQVIELIERMVEEIGSSLIFISHDIGLVSEVCDRIAVMYAGKIVESGNKEQIISEPMHPYTKALLLSFRSQSGKRMPFIPGRVPDLRTRQEGCSFAPRCSMAESQCWHSEPKLREISPGHEVACFRTG